MGYTEAEIQITVTFRHTESTTALKTYAMEKVTKCLKKYIADEVEVHVILSVEKNDHIAEINLHSRQYAVSCSSVTGDLYSAIDKVIDTVEAQIRKQKGRNLSQKHQAAAEF